MWEQVGGSLSCSRTFWQHSVLLMDRVTHASEAKWWHIHLVLWSTHKCWHIFFLTLLQFVHNIPYVKNDPGLNAYIKTPKSLFNCRQYQMSDSLGCWHQIEIQILATFGQSNKTELPLREQKGAGVHLLICSLSLSRRTGVSTPLCQSRSEQGHEASNKKIQRAVCCVADMVLGVWYLNTDCNKCWDMS